ncbi:MAG: exodeoxyribonuclease VII large subunit [Clostridiales bacterium]|nr:exodeoxyribonuclease VII large subunit [Clostridiales bacterium]
MSEQLVVTVSQLNRYVRSMLENDPRLSCLYVTGEISNFKDHYQSGHFYFSLKDEGGLIRSVMFRSAAARLRFRPENGMKVVCRGRISLYEKDGQYQFYAEDMQPDGAGSLAVAFEQIKARLAAEGLFAAERKRPLPKYPKRIAVVTSETGAAVRDVFSILGRRCPSVEILFCPVLVQGESAAPSMIDALTRVNRLGTADCIILGRGGGSAEDLWAFNDEDLARAVAASAIPVISAVGHETDFTICDFAADLRAPTPSAAAELAVPDREELRQRIRQARGKLHRDMTRRLQTAENRLRTAADRPALRAPSFLLDQLEQRLDGTRRQLEAGYRQRLTGLHNRFAAKAAALEAMSPLKVLARGYAVARKEGRPLRSATEADVGDPVEVQLAAGRLRCRVEGIDCSPVKNQ